MSRQKSFRGTIGALERLRPYTMAITTAAAATQQQPPQQQQQQRQQLAKQVLLLLLLTGGQRQQQQQQQLLELFSGIPIMLATYFCSCVSAYLLFTSLYICYFS